MSVSVRNEMYNVVLTALSFLAAFAFRDLFVAIWDQVLEKFQNASKIPTVVQKIIGKVLFFIVVFGLLVLTMFLFGETEV